MDEPLHTITTFASGPEGITLAELDALVRDATMAGVGWDSAVHVQGTIWKGWTSPGLGIHALMVVPTEIDQWSKRREQE